MLLLALPKAWSSRVAMHADRTTRWRGVRVVRVGLILALSWLVLELG